MIQCKFITLLPTDTGISWWDFARTEVNKISHEFNQWQINGFPDEEIDRINRLIEYGKQTITEDSKVAHELLDEMENFMKEYKEYLGEEVVNWNGNINSDQIGEIKMSNEKCKKCDVELIPSKALQNTWVGHIDFPGDEAFAVGSTITQSGPPVMTDCLKCPECGYSIGNAIKIPKPESLDIDDFDNHRVDL